MLQTNLRWRLHITVPQSRGGSRLNLWGGRIFYSLRGEVNVPDMGRVNETKLQEPKSMKQKHVTYKHSK